MARSSHGLLSLAGLLVGLAAYGANAQSGNFTTFADFVAAYNGTDLTIFTAALNKTGLSSTIASFNGTIFIPNDAAFTSFATSLGLANATALLNLSQDVLTSLLKYHVLPLKVDITTPSFLVSSNLSTPTAAAAMYSKLVTLQTPTATASLVSSVTIPFTSAGNASVAVITQVMAWWYSTIADAINDNSRFNQLEVALMNNGLWAGLSDESLRLVVFAPENSALLGVRTDFNIDMKPNSTMATNMMTYMQTYNDVWQNTNFTANVNANYTFTSIYNNMTVVANQTGANKVAVRSMGSVAQLTGGTIQIGGPYPKSLIHVMGYPLIPTTTNIWALIEKDPNFSVLVSLFLKEGKEYQRLQERIVNGQTTSTATPYTLMAPNNAALNKFAANYNTVVGNLTDLIGANNLAAFLRNHIIIGSYNTANLTAGVQLSSIQTTTKKIVVTTSGSTIYLAADKTIGTVIAPFNNAVAYGWTYVQVLDYPLVPEVVTLPSGGSAGTVLPSLMVVLMGLVAALMML
ncbi:hypothetical protein HXX76_016113 [Chlamydomonas incerta]|uniref:FAS1 domain-containing protein n=1 Tax=Chlamydomonas incerta TaxID=51695 RepID=A0A835VQQ5_CHLIN|nr:hypothetical protein HXX76_016113 [Chlamydomonas incerta]|eukprot:KAG2422353.1 hypothetical protein HXX76_016113 [Chlamydomonas incerta]